MNLEDYVGQDEAMLPIRGTDGLEYITDISKIPFLDKDRSGADHYGLQVYVAKQVVMRDGDLSPAYECMSYWYTNGTNYTDKSIELEIPDAARVWVTAHAGQLLARVHHDGRAIPVANDESVWQEVNDNKLKIYIMNKLTGCTYKYKAEEVV